MAPKKSKASKMSLEFLGETLDSFFDRTNALSTAPAITSEEDNLSRSTNRFCKCNEFAAPQTNRQFTPAQEDLPPSVQPPYTVFVGNLAFDLTEVELETFFHPHEINSIKVVRDRDGKPKGFGYVEFADLDALNNALTRTGEILSGRTIRVSIAKSPKRRV
ncbi:hypothetical protein J3A83DRAFT_2926519 [Scleroderma citrinum]